MLVVEDSLVVREFLVHVLESDPQLTVVGTASTGQEALEAVARLKPQVITMDIYMPGMNGFAATRRIMETHPTPIVIVSGNCDTTEVWTTFRAMEAGALAVLPRPAGIGHPSFERTSRELVKCVKAMAGVKVVRRWPRKPVANPSDLPPRGSLPKRIARPGLVAIGASTGGPVVLQTILSRLSGDFPAPLLIVQHMAAGFIQGFAEWLTHSTGFPVKVVSGGEEPCPGHAYVAPDDQHMKVVAGGHLTLSREKPEHGLRPSVSPLFRSVAAVYGRDAVGVLLTGMGKDGSRELKLLKDRGAVTVAQSAETSVVHGMPGEAIRLEAATHVLSPEAIADLLLRLADGA